MDRQTRHALEAHIDAMTDTLVTRRERSPWNTIGRMMYATARLRYLLGLPGDPGLDTVVIQKTQPPTTTIHSDPADTSL